MKYNIQRNSITKKRNSFFLSSVWSNHIEIQIITSTSNFNKFESKVVYLREVRVDPIDEGFLLHSFLLICFVKSTKNELRDDSFFFWLVSYQHIQLLEALHTLTVLIVYLSSYPFKETGKRRESAYSNYSLCGCCWPKQIAFLNLK